MKIDEPVNSTMLTQTSVQDELFRLPRWLEVLIGIVVVLQLIAPFITSPSGPDGPIHVYWIEKYDQLLRAGVFPPHWLPLAFRGFGSPTFYYYPPFSFLLAGAISFATGTQNPIILFQSVVGISTALSLFGMWKLLERLGASRYWMWIGALLYTFAPYRVAEIYSRSSLSSIVGYGWLPFVCLGLLWIGSQRKDEQLRGVALSSLSMALVVLSSLPLAMVIAIAGLLVSILARKYISARMILLSFTAALLAFAADAFFLFPMAEFNKAIHLSNATGDPEFALLDLFRGIAMPGVYHTAIIYTGILLIGIAHWTVGRKLTERNLTKSLTLRLAWGVSILILLIDLPISLPIWRHVPIFTLIQGPWRFYIFVVLFFAVIVGLFPNTKLQRPIIATISIWMIGALIPMLLVTTNSRLYFHQNTIAVDPAGFLPSGATDSVFASNTPERFLPVLEHLSAQPCFIDSPELTAQEYCTRTSFGPTTETYNMLLLTAHIATFHRFQWPAWHLFVNNNEILSRPDSFGRAQATLPEGHYTLKWQLEKTPLEISGLWISGIAWIGLILMWGIGLGFRRFKKEPPVS